MTVTEETITISRLTHLAFCNSSDLPRVVKIWDKGQKRGKNKRPARWIFREWVGIGWIEIEEKPGAVEVIDD